ncbi:MAG: YeaH/YhbH family protein [Planctomycetota bacterium]
MHVIDRRRNPTAQSLGNRQRFVRRVKSHIRESVKKAIQHRKVSDLGGGEEVTISSGDISEPSFNLDRKAGRRDYVLPGNHGYQRGDRIRKPDGGGRGRGKDGSADGDGEDAFVFTLTREEFLDLFFEDLELPNLAKKKLKTIASKAMYRAGYANDGSPQRLNKRETMRRSLARRLTLRRPKTEELEALEAQLAKAIEEENEDAIARLRPLIDAMKSRMRSVPYLDEVDLRFNRFEQLPKPSTQAVMFCLMDTSASMTEPLKDLAKRFYMLLHLFLIRHYRSVDIVFIRHTYTAQEVDEDTFFHGRETGGTVVSSALIEMLRIVEQRYPADDWNIYAAQASDGHNFDHDMSATMSLLDQKILPLCQYYAYIEVGDEQILTESVLWEGYSILADIHPHFARAHVYDPADIYPVFHNLFTSSRQAS